MAKEVVSQRGIAIRTACAVFSISESCYRYESKQNAENEEIADLLVPSTWSEEAQAELSAKNGPVSPNPLLIAPAIMWPEMQCVSSVTFGIRDRTSDTNSSMIASCIAGASD